jgi:hypothetical protein
MVVQTLANSMTRTTVRSAATVTMNSDISVYLSGLLIAIVAGEALRHEVYLSKLEVSRDQLDELHACASVRSPESRRCGMSAARKSPFNIKFKFIYK